MLNERTPWMSSETCAADLANGPAPVLYRPSRSDFGDPAIPDRSTRSLMILMGYEYAQNGNA
jgi:hypothetical protein